MNRNLYLCHFSSELQSVLENYTIYNNQTCLLFWTCPLAINHLKYKTTKTFWKREPLTDNYQKTKLPVISIAFLLFTASGPSNVSKIAALQCSCSSHSTQASKQRQSRAKPPSSGIQFGVLRGPNQRNINVTEKCRPAWATALTKLLEFLSLILAC